MSSYICQLSDVTRGGATAFPRLGTAVWPAKGSAAFWYNLKRSGVGSQATLHGACPVVHGSKWGEQDAKPIRVLCCMSETLQVFKYVIVPMKPCILYAYCRRLSFRVHAVLLLLCCLYMLKSQQVVKVSITSIYTWNSNQGSKCRGRAPIHNSRSDIPPCYHWCPFSAPDRSLLHLPKELHIIRN